jgi:thiol-disulfide isomerase/thioredoxin
MADKFRTKSFRMKNENKKWLVLVFLAAQSFVLAQSLELRLNGYAGKVFLSSLAGEKISLVDSASLNNGKYFFDNKNLRNGIYRLSFDKNNRLDFINDGKDVSLSTNANSVLDSLRIIKSESNKLFYSFLKLNKAYKTKTELLQVILARYPKDDNYYNETKKRLSELQSEYLQFVNIRAQTETTSFAAKYIRSAQLPIIGAEIPIEKQLDYLKAHALDNVNFNDASLINSDLYTNKTIEYLTYFRNPQLPKELLEKEFMKAVDTLLNKAKVHQLVYQHITEYLIDGFKKFGFDQVLDYIVENYVIKDDLCLDVKTEGLIKRRIEQAKNFKIGAVVPNIILSDVNGKQTELSKINSDKVLIVFYASWCPHCKDLLPKLNELKKSQAGNKLEVLAISLDNKKEDWMSFVKSNCSSLINVSNLKGWDGKAAGDYFIYATPTMLLIDKMQKILAKPMTFDEVRKYLE